MKNLMFCTTIMLALCTSAYADSSTQQRVNNAWESYFSGVEGECLHGSLTLSREKVYSEAWICVRYGENRALLGFRGTSSREQGFLIGDTRECQHYVKPYNRERALSKTTCVTAITTDAKGLTVTALQQFMASPDLADGVVVDEFLVIPLKDHEPYTAVGYSVVSVDSKDVVNAIRLYCGDQVCGVIELSGITWLNDGKNWRPGTITFSGSTDDAVVITVKERKFKLPDDCDLNVDTLKSGGVACKE